MARTKVSVLLLLLTPLCQLSFAQHDSIPQVNKKRLTILAATAGLTYVGSMIALDRIWYSDFDREAFHFFNDAAEWKQMDKMGHLYSTFHASALGSRALRACNLSANKSAMIGSLTGFAIVSSIELFDGRSAAYGASLTDLAANLSGSLLFFAQQYRWKEIKIRPKFSFHRTSFAPQRPEVLGRGGEEVLKDYNGQTYWFSSNPASFNNHSRWPAWLDISIGYGAHEMTNARDQQNFANGLQPHRQFYLSFDFNSRALHTRSKWVKALLLVTKVVKVPAPALEITKNGFRFHPLYF